MLLWKPRPANTKRRKGATISYFNVGQVGRAIEKLVKLCRQMDIDWIEKMWLGVH